MNPKFEKEKRREEEDKNKKKKKEERGIGRKKERVGFSPCKPHYLQMRNIGKF